MPVQRAFRTAHLLLRRSHPAPSGAPVNGAGTRHSSRERPGKPLTFHLTCLLDGIQGKSARASRKNIPSRVGRHGVGKGQPLSSPGQPWRRHPGEEIACSLRGSPQGCAKREEPPCARTGPSRPWRRRGHGPAAPVALVCCRTKASGGQGGEAAGTQPLGPPLPSGVQRSTV